LKRSGVTQRMFGSLCCPDIDNVQVRNKKHIWLMHIHNKGMTEVPIDKSVNESVHHRW
jgi:hypothetical protein